MNLMNCDSSSVCYLIVLMTGLCTGMNSIVCATGGEWARAGSAHGAFV